MVAGQFSPWTTPTAKMVSCHTFRPSPCFTEPTLGRLTATIATEAHSSSSSHYSIAPLQWRRRQRQRQRTRQRHHHAAASSGPSRLRTILFASLCALLGCSPCIAAAAAVAFSLVDTSAPSIGYSEIIYDQSPPPARMVRRASVESKATSASSSSATSTTQAAASLPSPFDSGIGNNFTQPSCKSFFQSFLADTIFQNCVPLSLLLQTSSAFFTVEQSPVSLAQTLEASCNVDLPICSALMASYAREIQLSRNCAADLQAQNPIVMQAYDGFAGYDVMYHAGCLQDDSTGSYCFSDAVTNSSSPTSSYIYYLPLSVSLPTNTKPACTSCLENTMALFAGAASNKSQPVSSVYNHAASMVDHVCGAGFVNDSVIGAAAATAQADSSPSSSSSSGSSSAHTLLAATATGPAFVAAAVAIAFSILL